MKTRKFKCLIQLGHGQYWKTIDAANVTAARAEFEVLYGKENIKSGVGAV